MESVFVFKNRNDFRKPDLNNILWHIYLQHFHRICSRTVSVPYFNQSSKLIFSKLRRQKMKMNIQSGRVSLSLLEFDFFIKFCRVVFENFDLEVWFKYGTVRVREQI